MFNSKKILATHDGTFHADDVFACATIQLYLEQRNESYNVIRTRNQEAIDSADYVFDVGGVYDPKNGRYDHHQHNFNEQHENRVTFAAFGLAWRHFGFDLCDGNKEVFQTIDREIVSYIDAVDNGEVKVMTDIDGMFPLTFGWFMGAMLPSWKEDLDKDNIFTDEVVPLAKKFLSRSIKRTKDSREALDLMQEDYQNTDDPRLLVLDRKFSRFEVQEIVTTDKFPEVIYAIFPDKYKTNYRIVGTRKDTNINTPEIKKPFPAPWCGKKGHELANVTGVSDAEFCHKSGFLCVVNSKEGALTLAKKALEA